MVNEVPQGSIHGALLFIIFLNGIEIGIGSGILKFADDKNITFHVWTAVQKRDIFIICLNHKAKRRRRLYCC